MIESPVPQLRALRGTFVQETSPLDAILTITNPSEWNKNVPILRNLFWPLIKEAYSRTEAEVDRQLQITFENVDKIFIKTDGTKVFGFCCVESHKRDPSVAIIRDIIVRKEYQNTGIGKELYASLFSEPQFNGIISATTTLAAEINRFAVGNTRGFESFYGTMGTGNPEVERLRELDTDYLRATDVLAPPQFVLPPGNDGFVLTMEDYIPRLKKNEVESLPSGELKNQAEKILALQAAIDRQYGTDAPVVAGHLISIRKKRQPDSTLSA